MVRPVHVVFVIGALGAGGTETQLVLLARKLSKRNFRITVWALFNEGLLREVLEKYKIDTSYPKIPIKGRFHIKHLVTTGFLQILLQLFYFLKREKPDIVHTFLPENNVIGEFVAELAGISFRISSRRNWNHHRNGRPIFFWFVTYLNHQASIVFGNSRAVFNDLVDEGIGADRLRLIYNGIEVECFQGLDREVARSQRGLGTQELCLVVIANLHPRKRHVDVIEARNTIRAQLPKQWVIFWLAAMMALRIG